jgi:hypothetical protein
MNHEKLTTLAKKVFGDKFAKEYYLGLIKKERIAYIEFQGKKIVKGSYFKVYVYLLFFRCGIKNANVFKIAKILGMILFILGFAFIIGRVVYGLATHKEKRSVNYYIGYTNGFNEGLASGFEAGYIDGNIDARSGVVKEEYAEKIDNLMKQNVDSI